MLLVQGLHSEIYQVLGKLSIKISQFHKKEYTCSLGFLDIFRVAALEK